MPAVQENTVQPTKGNAGEHIPFGPNVPLWVEERIRPHGNQVMEGFNRIGGNGAERNHQAQA